LSSSEDRFSKSLFTLSQCRIADDDGSGDLLSRSQMHVDEWDEVNLVAQQRRRQKSRCIGGSWLFVVAGSVASTCIYREDLPRVTTSRNQLALSIKHVLDTTRNKNKRQKEVVDLRGFESDFGRPFTRTSCAHRPAPPGEARRGKRARAFVYPFSSPHSCKCIESNPLFKYASLHLY
jgi:hypothetical protein